MAKMPNDDILDGVGWRPRTRQMEGRRTERRVVEERGGKQHPMSGAGRIKGDGSTRDELIEVKDAKKEFRLREADLRKHYREALQVRKEGVFVIEFESGMQAEVRVIKP